MGLEPQRGDLRPHRADQFRREEARRQVGILQADLHAIEAEPANHGQAFADRIAGEGLGASE